MVQFISLLLIYIGIYAILSMSLNLIVGYTGLLSLCHAAFLAIGAYTTAVLMVSAHVGFWSALLISGILAAGAGLIIALPTLRLTGDYLAIATLGFGEIVKNIIINWDSLTRGPMGISSIPRPMFFGLTIDPFQKWQFMILVGAFVFLTFIVLRRVTRSRLGRALEAIREDEIAASAMGINTFKYKTFSFALGSFFAGIAGSLWAAYNQSISPGTFDFNLSVLILCMVVLGGLGTHWGSMLGAVIIVLASEFPRLLGISNVVPAQARQILFGLILVVMMIYKPSGLLTRRKPAFDRYAETPKDPSAGSPK
ncbi:MAG TPA: branched-chain amino acid ABC transporter permease [Spirochaetia bacterium]|nr:branched-chain amino acid ABC transporter permease [Spirochaetia bacterium]